MKKILFYCQYLTGMGHLVRSTEIIRSLVKEFKVCFVNGGPNVPGFEIPAEVETIKLPALWIEGGKLQVAEGFESIEEVKELRKNRLLELCDCFQPDCLITEFFPFGRHKLFFELLPLIKYLKKSHNSTKIVSSIRDIIGRKDLDKDEEIICDLTSQYYDLILCHSDPNFQRLEENFSRFKDLNCQVKYTGFVTQSQSSSLSGEDWENFSRKEPMILVSIGGGRIGAELIETVIEASGILEKAIPHRIQVFTGPFMEEETFSDLEKSASLTRNVNIQRYTSQLMAYMKKADLSISLSGYNTTMNILMTGVKSLVVPIGHYHQDEEQLVRTKKLEKAGNIQVIEPNKLEKNYLAEQIISALNRGSINNKTNLNLLDLNGAENTRKLLKDLLNSQIQTAA
jgi:predicted glycosyltransferase